MHLCCYLFIIPCVFYQFGSLPLGSKQRVHSTSILPHVVQYHALAINSRVRVVGVSFGLVPHVS
jgi:hypothetical protein